MEDDDEFGDLYTDVLLPFARPHPSSSPHRPIDLNLQTDDHDILHGAPHSISALPHQPTNQSEASSPNPAKPGHHIISPAAADSGTNLIERDQRDELPVGTGDGARDFEDEDEDVKLRGRASEDVNFGNESAIAQNRSEVGVKDADLMDKDVKFDIEEDGVELENVGSEPIIPGLSSAGGGDCRTSVHGSATNSEAPRRDDESGDRGEGDDWDSDSEDDLQIVLNDNNHGILGMERGGMMGNDDDEDEDGLVIVADGDTNQATEEQDWGEDAAQAADGERKEMCETGKSSGGVAVAPKIGYSNHGYHPFHSQFKVSVLRVA